MKRKITLLLLVTLVSSFFPLLAQTPLPYYTGFDNTAGTTGWTTYRKGSTANGSWSVATTGGFSPAKCIVHFYPVGGSVQTDDWRVSPGFDFSAGGNIDSLRTSFSGFGTPNTNDLVAIYLLRGSQNPTLTASDTMLFNFNGSNYVADNTWRLFTNIVIPPTSGTSYIAFRYRTTINWLDVKFDNLALSSNLTTGISEVSADNEILLFPNPVKEGKSIQLKFVKKNNRKYVLKIFNALGMLVDEKEMNVDQELLMDHPIGIYFYELNEDGKFAGSGKFVIE